MFSVKTVGLGNYAKHQHSTQQIATNDICAH
jgi:hypothetical protein